MLLIGVNAAMVAAEFSVMAVDRTRVSRLAREGSRGARRAEVLLERLSFHLSGAQLGITVTSLVLGAVAQPVVGSLIAPVLKTVMNDDLATSISLPLALGIAVAVQMILGELVPKTIAIARPLQTVLATGGSLRFIGVAAGPLVSGLNGVANSIVRFLGVEPIEELAAVRSLEEVELLIAASVREGSLVSDDVMVLTRALRFRAKDAADVLVPRVDVVHVPVSATLVDLVELSAASGHSRFPVTGDDLDDIRGTVHVKDVIGVPASERASRTVSSIASPAHIVVEYRELGPLLAELRAGGHLAIVVDEYGGTEGILTLEDVLEELVGEIDDEYDAQAEAAVDRGAGAWDLDGSLHRDEVADVCGLELDGENYETLAGYVLLRLGRLPVVGEGFDWNGWAFEVTAMDRLRVDSVRVTWLNQSDDTSEADRGAPKPQTETPR